MTSKSCASISHPQVERTTLEVLLFSRSRQTNDIEGGGLERLYRRVGTQLYMPPELLNPSSDFRFDRISAYQQGDMYSLALVLWEIGNCYCSLTHSRPYENLLPGNFTVEDLVRVVCREEKRPRSCLISSDQVRTSKEVV